MPNKPDVVKASTFTMTANDQATNAQANETYLLKAKAGKTLGSNGEKNAFAKVGLTDYLRELSQSKEQANVSNDAEALKQAKSKENKVENMLVAVSDMMSDPDHAKEIQASLNSEGREYDDRGLLTRAVASSEVAKLFNSKVVSEERFGVDEQGRAIGISVQADGAAVQSDYRLDGPDSEKVDCHLDINYADPEIQKGLYELEALDYVTGQYDRHSGNIYIDPATKQVTGIDNDLAFPEVSREQLIQNRGVECKAVPGMPDYLHKKTADKIMSVTPEQLEKTLRDLPRPRGASPLSENAIQGAKDRLTALQGAIQDSRQAIAEGHAPTIQVVDQFTPEHYAAAVQKQDAHINADCERHRQPKIGEWAKGTRPSAVTGAGVTSYVGTIRTHELLQQFSERKAELNPGGNIAVIRSRGPETALPASRDNAFVAKQVLDLEKQIASLQKQAAKYQERQDSPSLKDRFKAILPGNSKAEVVQNLATKQEQLLSQSAKLLEDRNQILNREAAQAAAQAGYRNPGPPAVIEPDPLPLNQSQDNIVALSQSNGLSASQGVPIVIPGPLPVLNASNDDLPLNQSQDDLPVPIEHHAETTKERLLRDSGHLEAIPLGNTQNKRAMFEAKKEDDGHTHKTAEDTGLHKITHDHDESEGESLSHSTHLHHSNN